MRTKSRSTHGPGRIERTGPTAAAALAITVALTVVAPLAAQSDYTLDRDDEIRLAMSAGPLSVSRDADVFVFGPNGFEQAVNGTNGFACMVIRVAGDPEILAPHCFSPDAVASVVPAKIEEGRLIAEGHPKEEVDRRLLARFDAGSLPLPEGGAYAYMLSGGQHLGPAGAWRPHFMIYMPYATNDDIHGSPGNPEFPFVGPETDHPHSTMVIVMTEFVDPADVEWPRGR